MVSACFVFHCADDAILNSFPTRRSSDLRRWRGRVRRNDPPRGVRRRPPGAGWARPCRSEEHTSELQSRLHLVCRLLLEKKTVRENFIKIFFIRKRCGKHRVVPSAAENPI